MTAPATLDLLRHLATRPGHDEVKADFRDLLVREFGVSLANLDSSGGCRRCAAASTR